MICSVVSGCEGLGALLAVLSVVMVLSVVTIAVAGFLEAMEDRALRSRCARRREREIAARRRGGCAVRVAVPDEDDWT